MTLDIAANYILQNDRNVVNQGEYNNPLVGAYLYPRGNEWADAELYEVYDPARKIYVQNWTVGDAGMTMQNPTGSTTVTSAKTKRPLYAECKLKL